MFIVDDPIIDACAVVHLIHLSVLYKKEKGTPSNSKDPESKKYAVRQPFGVKDMNNTRACDAEGSSSSMFWFLKPCTFLVE
ncbi:Polyadenylate-binding protein RBP47B' [Zea mays]|uniref:Polyadenylate-binding protein RBP47B n=1 Tax=Zea mays TaxID=4577 RepID=A0A1D6JQ83_MAIZE|nr:Polyadenylate-binding protein RBP47B' [Zea mays]